MRALTDFELGWIVALFEGEGCFYADPAGPRGLRYPRAKVHMTDEDVIARASTLLGHSYLRHHPASRAASGRKPTFILQLGGDHARDLMRLLQPRMGERRAAKIQEVLDVCAA